MGPKKMMAKRGRTNYNSFKFLSIEHEQLFNEVMKERDIIRERKLELEGTVLSDLPNNFEDRHWLEFLEHPSDCCKEIVREFYANAAELDGPNDYESYCRGKVVKFNPATINAAFGIPELSTGFRHSQLMNNGFDEEDVLRELCLPGANWHYKATGEPKFILRKFLKDVPLLLCNYVLSSVFPSLHATEIITERLIFIYLLMKGEPINLGLILANVIKEAYKGTGALPLPSLVYKLCVDAGVDPTIETKVEPGKTLGGVKFAPKRRRSDAGPSTLSDPIHTPEPEFRSSCVRERQPVDEERFQRLENRLTKIEKGMKKLRKGQRFIKKQLKAMCAFMKMTKRSKDRATAQTGTEGTSGADRHSDSDTPESSGASFY